MDKQRFNRRGATLTAAGVVIGTTLLSRLLRRRRAMDFAGRVALVTGGSRGLGLLIARELGRQGARVVVAARDEPELERARGDLLANHIDATTIAADISTEAGAQQMVADVIARYGQLDILINNAGIITVGPLEHMTVSDFEEAMAVHFWGPFHAMRAAVPHMRRAGGGRIANISSIGGKIGVPHLVPYCASKFALTGLSTAIRSELTRENILVTTVSPGLMRTGSPFNAWFKGQHRHEFAWFAIADSLPLVSIEGSRAAAQIVRALKHGDAELIVSWPARLASAIAAVAPNALAWTMGIANRVLPNASTDADDRSRRGWQSASRWAPSVLTRLSERAAAANNETV